MNYEKIYEYRFKGVDQKARERVWLEISKFLYNVMGKPAVILDPAAGRCEFLNHVPSQEKWGVDLNHFINRYKAPAVKSVIGDIFDVDLPFNFFDAVFMSNFLEHLESPQKIANLFKKIHSILKPGGVICIMGPNFKYCANEYFDCADHLLALTHISVEELLYSENFSIERSYSKFLPYSFRGILPPSPWLTATYLKIPLSWRFLGKQFLLVAKKESV